MKKLLFVLLLFSISIGMFSQKINLKSGSLDFLKRETSFTVLYTYNDMTVGSKTEAIYVKEKVDKYNKKEAERGDRWHQAWIADREFRFEPKFEELYNKYIEKKNGPKIGDEGSYILTINTDFTEPGFNVGVMRENARINLTCTFANQATGEIVAVVSIKNANGGSAMGGDFDTAIRIQESYAKAGKEFAKYLIKHLKL